MTFEPKKFEQIYTDMVRVTQERLPGVTDFRVGSVVRTMYESFAYEMAVLYEQMHQVYLSAFVDTAEGAQLDMLVAILGIQRGLPDFAEGVVTFERDPGTEAIEIPIGTLITTEDTEKSPQKPYKTIELKLFPAEQVAIEVKVQAVERGEEQVVEAEAISIMPQPIPGVKSVINKAATQFTGKQTETDAELRQRAKSMLLASGKASRTALETALLSLPGVKEVKVQERFQQNTFGLVDVFVDGVDFTNEAKVQTLQSQIDRVRAAGVLVRLQAAIKIAINAVFLIEVNEGLSIADQLALEGNVQKAIATHIADLKMGQPLLFAQLVKTVLSVSGVSNLEQFELVTHTAERSQRYSNQDRRIEADESSKFVADHIQATAVRRSLPIQIQFHSLEVNRDRLQQISTALKAYFSQLTLPKRVERSAIEALISPIVYLEFNSVRISAQPWASTTEVTTEYIQSSMIEDPQLAEPIFGYAHSLGLIGALKFTTADTATNRDKARIQAEIRDRIVYYLDQLQPEQDIDLLDLQQSVQKDTTEWTVAPLIPEDFRVISDGNEEVRLDKSKIEVREFEKAQIGYFCITSKTESVDITITALQLKLILPPTFVQQQGFSADAERALREGRATALDLGLTPTETTPLQASESVSQNAIAQIQTAIVEAVTRALTNFPAETTPGNNISYADVEATILQPMSTANLQSLLRGITYTIEQLSFEATSAVDERLQTRDRVHREDLHIRSAESLMTLAIEPVVIHFSYFTASNSY